jgi:hypothetical protein
MKVSLPYFAGSTVKTLPKSQSQTEITNSHASTERQDLPPDQIEISSQVLSISESDLSEIGENYWDLLETQSEPPSNPWTVDSFLQLPQKENQTATQQNPFQNHSATLPSQIALPAKQSPQTDILENPDSNEKKLSKKIKRPSRHPQNQDVLTSEQTDDEFESEDTAIKKKAKSRIHNRRSSLKRAKEITGNPNARGADYSRLRKTILAKKQTGSTNATHADYDRGSRLKRAKEITGNPNARGADYNKFIKTRLAKEQTGNPNATHADYDRLDRLKRAKRKQQEVMGNPNATDADHKRAQKAKQST